MMDKQVKEIYDFSLARILNDLVKEFGKKDRAENII